MAIEPSPVAATLRKLADVVEGNPAITACVDTETVGRMVKTSVVIWSVAPDAVPTPPQVRWCDRLIPHFGAPDTLCRQMLREDGTCPREAAHRMARQW
jgi:hypothetical protein